MQVGFIYAKGGNFVVQLFILLLRVVWDQLPYGCGELDMEARLLPGPFVACCFMLAGSICHAIEG